MGRKRYGEPYEKRCENCHMCVRVSNSGKYKCEDGECVVIENHKRTDNYMWCRSKGIKEWKWEGRTRNGNDKRKETEER